MRTGPRLAPLTHEWAPLDRGSAMELAGTRFTVLDVTGPRLIRSRLPFAFEVAEGEQAARFRERYHPEEAVAPGRTEVDQLKLLRDWVADRVPFGRPEHHNVDPFYIMDRAAEGALHNCTFNSVVYLAALESLGHTARKLSTCGHGMVEVWSGELARWIALDPSRRNCFLLDGRVLGAHEVHEQFHADGGVPMHVEYGLGERIEPVTTERREDGHMKYRQDGYEWVGYHDRNDFMRRTLDFDRDRFYIYSGGHNCNRAWTTGPADSQSQAQLDERYAHGTLTDRLEDLYWSVNVTEIHLAPRAGTRVAVRLDTMAPNFDSFLLERDGKWELTRAEFSWRVRRGANCLRVRARNSRGILGPGAAVTVESSPVLDTMRAKLFLPRQR